MKQDTGKKERASDTKSLKCLGLENGAVLKFKFALTSPERDETEIFRSELIYGNDFSLSPTDNLARLSQFSEKAFSQATRCLKSNRENWMPTMIALTLIMQDVE